MTMSWRVQCKRCCTLQPQVWRPPRNNFKMAGFFRYYQSADSLPNIMNAGARCRTCGVIYSTDRNAPLGFCPAHDNSDTVEAELGHFAVDLMNASVARCKTHRRASGRTLTPFPAATPSETRWWKMVEVLHCMCEHSLRSMAPILKGAMEGIFRTSESSVIPAKCCPNLTIEDARPAITFVAQWKFYPHQHYWYKHCVFAIGPASGHLFVFDPTGVQFGPHWPLISPFRQYMDRFWAGRSHPSRYHCAKQVLGQNCAIGPAIPDLDI